MTTAVATDRGRADPPAPERFEGDGAEWDAFVAGDPAGTACHRVAWREVMSDVLGHECLYTVARDGEGAVRGLLPLVRVRSRLFGHYLVSMPFLNDGGPLGDAGSRKRLAAAAAGEAARSDADLLELRSRCEVPGELRVSQRKITVMLDLPGTAETLWEEGFRAKLRSQIRRPMKEGYDARFGAGECAAFYDVFARNMRDLGTPVLPRRFFERIRDLLPAEALFGVVYDGATPIAGGCGFLWGGEFEITWASSLREYNATAPNMLLYWAFMREVIARGARRFNFGRCTPGGGTHRFKRQWGGEDVPLPWAQWSPGAVDATPAPDRPVFRAATAVWRRIPVPVANRLGPLLARRIP